MTHSPSGNQAGATRKRRIPKWLKIVGIVFGVLIVLSAIGSMLGLDDDEPDESRTADEQDESPEPEDDGMIEIPDVSGLIASDARSELRDLGFSTEYDTEDPGGVWDADNWQVDRTAPEAGESLEEGEEVILHVVRSDDYVADQEERQAERDAAYSVERDDSDPGGTAYVRFEISDNFSQGMIASGAQRDTCSAIQRALDEEPDVARIVVEGTFPTMDEYGNQEDDSVILRPIYEMETVDRIDMDNCQIIDVWDLRDGGMINQQLQDSL